MATFFRFLLQRSNCSQKRLDPTYCIISRLRSGNFKNFLQARKLLSQMGHDYTQIVKYEDKLLQPGSNHLIQLNCFYGNGKKQDKHESVKKSSTNAEQNLKMLYVKDYENLPESRSRNTAISKDEYYKQAWHREMEYEKTRSGAILCEGKTNGSVETNSITCNADTSNALPENVFGLLNEMYASPADNEDHNERMDQYFEDDEEDRDWRMNIPLSKYGRRARAAEFYNQKIKTLANQGKIKEAVAVFDKWMMVEDRVRPNKITFVTLIAHLSKLGHTRKAFQLYTQMKQLGLDPPDKVYSLLFNSCENCPMPHYGLNRANSLYHHMKDTRIELNLKTVKSAMRAFARCGDFAKTFQILDEKEYPLDTQFFDALLMACVSDKKTGFKRALQVWMLMGEYNIKPEGTTYNLLARCIRDNGIGEPSTFTSDLAMSAGRLDESTFKIDLFDAKEVSKMFPNLFPLHDGNREQHLKDLDENLSQSGSFPIQMSSLNVSVIGSGTSLSPTLDSKRCTKVENEGNIKDKNNTSKTDAENELSSSQQKHSEYVQNSATGNNFKNPPQSSCKRPVDVTSDITVFNETENVSSLTNIENEHSVRISDLNMPSGRLSFIGGVESLISHMESNGVHPDVKTFTLLLSSLPNNKENEAMLLKLMESFSVTPEIDFLNDVMMRRNRRYESHTQQEIMGLISRLRLTPNMRTYAALAMACHKEEAGFSLIEDMKAANLEPTKQVLAHFFIASRLNFKYKLRLLMTMEDLAVKPDERMIKGFEKSISKAKQKIILAEKRGSQDGYLSPYFQKSFQQFLKFYRPWLKRTEIDKPRHPWDGLEDIILSDTDKKINNTNTK